MISWKYLVQDPEGLHARPVARIAMAAMKASCQITVYSGKGSADGKNLMALMALGARQNDMLEFRFAGKDEEEISEVFRSLLAEIGL